jgi:hypothetical protein
MVDSFSKIVPRLVGGSPVALLGCRAGLSTDPLGRSRVSSGSTGWFDHHMLRRKGAVMLFVGDDWAEDHHDVYLMDEAGVRLEARRLPEGLTGVGQLHDLVAAYADDPGEVIVGIEKDHGPWVGALAASGYEVYAVNPMAVARYRDRHRLSGAKSDAADAKLLADLVRTDRHNHRQLDGDSDAAEAIKVLARAHQGLIWTRTRQVNALRAGLLEYYPAALQAFPNLRATNRACRAVFAPRRANRACRAVFAPRRANCVPRPWRGGRDEAACVSSAKRPHRADAGDHHQSYGRVVATSESLMQYEPATQRGDRRRQACQDRKGAGRQAA